MLGIATLLDGTPRSAKFMEAMRSVELLHKWKRMTIQWARVKDFSNALECGIIGMVSVQKDLEITLFSFLCCTR